MIRHLSFVLALITLPAGATGLGDEVFDQVGFDQRIGAAVPQDLGFRAADGSSVRLGDLLGERPALLTLVDLDCPNLCGLTIAGLIEALGKMELRVGEAFDVLVVSIDPREGPSDATEAQAESLRRYRREGEAGWHFLTGAAVAEIAEAIGFRYRYDEALEQFAHPAGVVIVNPDGTLGRYLYGVRFEPRDLRLGLVEAGEGRIGSLTDQALLLCYRYDPEKGAYSGLAMGLLRIGGILAAAVLIGFAGVALVRERRAGS